MLNSHNDPPDFMPRWARVLFHYAIIAVALALLARHFAPGMSDDVREGIESVAGYCVIGIALFVGGFHVSSIVRRRAGAQGGWA
jgi:hypothetical protein